MHSTSQIDLRRQDFDQPVSALDYPTARSEAAGGLASTDFPVAEGSRPWSYADDDSLRTLAIRRKPSGHTWMQRPALWARSMWAMLLVMLAMMTMLAAMLAFTVAEVSQELQAIHYQEPPMALEQPLPPAAVLRDDERFAEILGDNPQLQRALLLARAEALLDAGRDAAAGDIVRRLSRPYERGVLSSAQLLQLAELNIRLGRVVIAQGIINEAELAQWPEGDRRRAVALLGRMLAAR